MQFTGSASGWETCLFFEAFALQAFTGGKICWQDTRLLKVALY